MTINFGASSRLARALLVRRWLHGESYLGLKNCSKLDIFREYPEFKKNRNAFLGHKEMYTQWRTQRVGHGDIPPPKLLVNVFFLQLIHVITFF